MAATGKREADDARESLAAALGRANARIAELTSKSAQLARYDVEVVRAHKNGNNIATALPFYGWIRWMSGTYTLPKVPTIHL